MPTLTIKWKVSVAFVVATLLAASGLYYSGRASYERNVSALSQQSLDIARNTFAQLSSAEVGKMQAVVTAVVANRALVAKISMSERAALLEEALPLFQQLKRDQGITNFNFIDRDEKRILIMTDPKDPKLIGTKAVRFNVQDAAQTKTWSSGLGLGFHGLALRVSHPVYDGGQLKGGNLVGYLELGVEINTFVSKLKTLTGHEFGLVVKKRFLDQEKWATGRAKTGLRNNWGDQPDAVVASNTMPQEDSLRMPMDVTSIPDAGAMLGMVRADGRQFAKSVFPVRDAAHEKIGAVLVLTDVTRATEDLRQSLIRTIAISVVLVTALMLLLLMLLETLVFRRLAEVSRVVTRVVGGDFETPIPSGNRDEIGQFAALLEQFRGVVVGLIGDLQSLQSSAETTTKKPNE